MHNPIEQYTIDELPFGIFSDLHGNLVKTKQLFDKHPEIKQWFNLGDIVDFENRFKDNDKTVEWWKLSNIPSLLGNHECYYFNDRKTLDWQVNDKIKSLPWGFKLNLPTGVHILCYHSLPNDPVTFVEKGYTERQFVDDYPLMYQDTVAVVIGHNHKQFKHYFPNTRAEIWSVGSLGWYGEYAIIDENGIKFHQLPPIDVSVAL